MNTSTAVKIWTLICHSLILIGAGHGGIIMLFMNFAPFWYIIEEGLTVFSSPDDLVLVGLFNLVGHIAILFSIFQKIKSRKFLLHIAGISILWLGLIYLIIYSSGSPGTVVIYISIIPFLICTIITFLGPQFAKLKDRLWKKI